MITGTRIKKNPTQTINRSQITIMGNAEALFISSLDSKCSSSRIKTLPEYMTKITMAAANAKYSWNRHGVFLCQR